MHSQSIINRTQSVSDEAIEVLQKTRDGDDLAPRDLALLQSVVNAGGLEYLNEAGVARWRSVVNSVRAGEYQSVWFHGVEHLTKNHGGYVMWRGKTVEHYSFGAAEEAEEAAANHLGACCRRLERDGIGVTSGGLFALYARMRRAAEMGPDVPRRLAMWNSSGPSIDLRVCLIEADDDAGIAAEMQKTFVEFAGDPSSGRTTQIPLITKEDYDVVVGGIEQCCGHIGEGHPLHGEPGRSLSVLEALAPRASLLSREEVEAAYLGASPASSGGRESLRERCAQ